MARTVVMKQGADIFTNNNNLLFYTVDLIIYKAASLTLQTCKHLFVRLIRGRGNCLVGMGWELGISKMPGGTKEDYDILEEIGSGSFGICQKIRRKTDNMVLHADCLYTSVVNTNEKAA